MLLLRGMGDGGIVSQGPVWTPSYDPTMDKPKVPAAPPPPSNTKLVVATAGIAAALTGLALTFNWKKLLR